MKVAEISLFPFRIPFRRPYVTAAGTAETRDGLIFRLRTDTGIVGYGESSVLPHNPIQIEDLADPAEAAAKAALGQNLDLTPNANPAGEPAVVAARSGLEMAAWDARAQDRALPLARLLNPKATQAVAVNALLSQRSLDKTLTAARKAVAAGFKTLKLKVGTLPDLAGEEQRLAAVRAVVGADIKLRLDANGAWGEAEAGEILNAFAAYDIEYVEQPIAAGNLEAMRRLRSRTSTRIALDEDVTSFAAAQNVLAAKAADFLILKPICLGGIDSTIKIAEAAWAAGVEVVITTSIDTGVGTAAALHLAAALPDQNAAGLATLDLLSSHLLKTAPAIQNGCMAIRTQSGLGVEPDPAALARFALRRIEVTP